MRTSLNWPLYVFNTGVITFCHQSFAATVPGMAQLLDYLPPADDEQVCPPDCVLVSEEGQNCQHMRCFSACTPKIWGRCWLSQSIMTKAASACRSGGAHCCKVQSLAWFARYVLNCR